ncbi:hypothetical protein AVEN_114193-1 [Araneus ventricosus]|uniref:Uncharacterized protein n=1 Tax=Araneus ventricosus TaxID=182803 RepID=A0A4Y2X9W7_ARAVE|nr:hypothetical protein AVEN_114193-1 [Araneus ventricosus]
MLFNVSQCYGASFIVADVRELPRDLGYYISNVPLSATLNRVHMSSHLLSHYMCACLNETRPLEIFTYDDSSCVLKREGTLRWSAMDGTDFFA